VDGNVSHKHYLLKEDGLSLIAAEKAVDMPVTVSDTSWTSRRASTSSATGANEEAT
jgi:hypothetical protein